MTGILENVLSKKANPIERSNIISRLCFCWLIPYLIKGYRKVLTEDDMYVNRNEHDSEMLCNKLEMVWEHQMLNKKKASLFKALCLMFLWEFLCICLAAVIGESCRLAQPFVISKMLNLYDEKKTLENKMEIYIYAFLLICSSILSILSYHYFVLEVAQVGMKMRIACSSLIYRKSLKLSHTAFTKTSAGQIVNLLSNDVGRLENTIFLNHIFMAPLETLLVIALIYISVGWYGLVGTVFLIFSMAISSFLGKKNADYRMSTAKRTDRRIFLMNQIISGIEVVKMFTWEKPFGKLIDGARENEIKKLKLTATVRALIMFSSLIYTKVAMLLSVLTFVLTGNILNSSYIFTLTTFFRLLTTTTTFFPIGISQLAEMITSIKRIQTFLLYDNFEPFENPHYDARIDQDKEKYTVSNAAILFTNVSARWQISTSDLLKDVDWKIEPGELVSLIGPSGSGKSTLLHVILQELSPSKGKTQISGTISYSPQEPWLFGGTLRQNILFGESFNEEKYNEVVRVCSLERDFSDLFYGDGTLTGDRGFALSGGQRARISLARAIYREADIYLLDDPLSAVDSHVGKQIFDACILGYLKNKTVILVTHQIQYLKDQNNIYLLKDGSFKHFSSFNQLEGSTGKYFQEQQWTLKSNPKNEDTTTLNKTKKVDQKLTKEDKCKGEISGKVYKIFFQAGGHWIRTILLISLFMFSQAADSIFDYFVTFWINMEQKPHHSNGTKLLNVSQIEENKSSDNSTNIFVETIFDGHQTVLYYIILFFIVVGLTLSKSLYFYMWCIRVSTWMHKNMFNKILYSPMRFFNQNPSGRILNRFSKDLGILDELIPLTLTDTINIGLNIVAICIVVGTITPWILAPSLLMFILFYFMRKVFLETSRDVKRIESITRGPLFTHLAESLHGLTTIRAFKAQKHLKQEFDTYQNINSSAFFMFLGATRTYGFWLDMVCVIYIGFVIIFLLFVNEETLGGNIGLALTQAMGLTLTLQRGMRLWGELENQMISVERIQEYIDSELELDNKVQAPEKWPKHPRIVFNKVIVRYAEDLPPALKGISFTVEAKQKVGIVGRTGAGKSSILQALLRLTDMEGSILIDDVNIQTISLEILRSKISIIPQVPILFSGTVRQNLDPFGEHSDEILWKALEDVEMKSIIEDLPQGLNTSGANFSIGEKQLLCLARAITYKNPILFMDEATSSVDPHTDSLIQKTIRAKFLHCTVLTIAHRLNTVMDSDKILVMDDGRVVEFDTPENLLKKKAGYFYSLVMQSGAVTEHEQPKR